MNNNYELYHYGVLGMKWGVRRGRRLDTRSEDAKEYAAIKKKHVSQMTNAELKKANERMNLEQQYSRLNPNAIKKGAKAVAISAVATTTILTLYNNSGKLIKIGKQAVKAASKIKK